MLITTLPQLTIPITGHARLRVMPTPRKYIFDLQNVWISTINCNLTPSGMANRINRIQNQPLVADVVLAGLCFVGVLRGRSCNRVAHCARAPAC